MEPGRSRIEEKILWFKTILIHMIGLIQGNAFHLEYSIPNDMASINTYSINFNKQYQQDKF